MLARIRMKDKIEDIKFVIVDVETTGLSPFSGDRICEIAAVEVKNKEILDVFHSLVNPQRQISAAASAVNHITNSMVKDAPSSRTIMSKFLGFIKGSCLVGHNVNFDMGFIRNELSLIGKSISQNTGIIDTLSMARSLLPKFERHALWYLSQALNLRTVQEHRALSDVKLTKQVFDKLIDLARGQGVDSFSSLHNLFGVNSDLNDMLNDDKISSIKKAINSKAMLEIQYLSFNGSEVTKRKVSPEEIKEQRNNYFLDGFCHLRNEKRSFRVDRIIAVKNI